MRFEHYITKYVSYWEEPKQHNRIHYCCWADRVKSDLAAIRQAPPLSEVCEEA